MNSSLRFGPARNGRTAPQRVNDSQGSIYGKGHGMYHGVPPRCIVPPRCMFVVDVETDELPTCGKLATWTYGWHPQSHNFRHSRFYCEEHGTLIYKRNAYYARAHAKWR